MKNNVSATIEFFRALKAKNVRSNEQTYDVLRTRLPKQESEEVIEHLNEEVLWGDLDSAELDAMESFRNASYERSLAISLVHYYSRTREVHSYYESRKRFIGHRILDVGCRNGLQTCFLGFLCPEAEVVGVDSLPYGLPHARKIAENLKIANVEFFQKWLEDYDATEKYDTIILTRPMARNGFMGRGYANYMSLLDAAYANAKAYSAFAKKVSSLLKVGGHVFFSDICAYDATFLGLLLALAEVGIVWNSKESNRGSRLAVDDAPVLRVNSYDLLFVKESGAPVEAGPIIDDFIKDAFTDAVEGRPGLFLKENAHAMMHLHAGEALAGFTSTFEFEDGGAEEVVVIGWKDREGQAAWLEIQCNKTCVVHRFPIEKADWVAREVWINARIVARDCPDIFDRLSGTYNDLDAEKITDASTLPEGNPEDGGEDEKAETEQEKPPLADPLKLGSMLSPLDGTFMKKKWSPVDANTSALFSSVKKVSVKTSESDGPGFSDIKGFRVMRPKAMDTRQRKKKPVVEAPAPVANAVPPDRARPEVAAPSSETLEEKLRLTFISKSGRLNVENKETGVQWRADATGVRIEDEAIGHIVSRRIEDTDFTMTTSESQIVLRDDSCGYEFTIRLV